MKSKRQNKAVPEQAKLSAKNSDRAAKADGSVFQQSEKPRNKRIKNEEIIQAIIEKDRQKGDDIAILEAEMLAAESDHDEEEFQPLLPDLSGCGKEIANNVDWKDVDPDLLLATNELMDDCDLMGDPNISAICPPFDSGSKNSKCRDENINGTSSKLKSKAKLNCTVPKNMAGFWNDSKRLNLK